MHEALLTRGDVQGAPFEARAQIFVSVNCVLVHPGDCHRIAQHESRGLMLCLAQLLDYHRRYEIIDWLGWMQVYLHDRKPTYLIEYIQSFHHVPPPDVQLWIF